MNGLKIEKKEGQEKEPECIEYTYTNEKGIYMLWAIKVFLFIFFFFLFRVNRRIRTENLLPFLIFTFPWFQCVLLCRGNFIFILYSSIFFCGYSLLLNIRTEFWKGWVLEIVSISDAPFPFFFSFFFGSSAILIIHFGALWW